MKIYSKTSTVFPITFQNKTKMSGKNRTCRVYAFEVASYINYIPVQLKELSRV